MKTHLRFVVYHATNLYDANVDPRTPRRVPSARCGGNHPHSVVGVPLVSQPILRGAWNSTKQCHSEDQRDEESLPSWQFCWFERDFSSSLRSSRNDVLLDHEVVCGWRQHVQPFDCVGDRPPDWSFGSKRSRTRANCRTPLRKHHAGFSCEGLSNNSSSSARRMEAPDHPDGYEIAFAGCERLKPRTLVRGYSRVGTASSFPG